MDSWLGQLILIGVGGFLGANVRAVIASLVAEKVGSAFPYGTALINITGSFMIGVILAFLGARTGISPAARLFFVTGFLGAYTTFSTFSYESLLLIEEGQLLRLLIYVAGSVVLGLLAVAAGVWAGRFIA